MSIHTESVYQAIRAQLVAAFPSQAVVWKPSNGRRWLDIDVVDKATGATVFVTLRTAGYHRTWPLHDSDLLFLRACMAQAQARALNS